MSKELVKISKQESSFNKILRFMTEGDITLSGDDEMILHRWTYAHKLHLQNKYTSEQIADKIKEIHAVSIYTARNDVYQSMALFAGSIKSNKRYLLHYHAEGIRLFMEQCKNDKSLVHLVPKLADAYTKAVKELPTDEEKPILPPPVMNFFLVPGQEIKVDRSYEEAIKNIVDASKAEYLDFSETDSNDQHE